MSRAIIKNSIIFKLGLNLELYRLDSVNGKLVLIEQIEPKDGPLSLSDNFEHFWKKNWVNELKPIQKIYFFIEQRGGFTDTRVVYLWLKTWQMFNAENVFFVHKLIDSLELESIEELYLNLSQIIKTRKLSSDLVYSNEPRIGATPS